MKYILTFLFIIFSNLICGQTRADSIINAYEKTRTNKERMTLLKPLGMSIMNESLDNWKHTSIEVITFLKSKKQDSLADLLELWVAYGFNTHGDYSNSLQLSTNTLDRLIKRKDSVNILFAYNTIAYSYSYSKNYNEAIANFKKAIPFLPNENRKSNLFDIYNAMAESYASAFMPDSGMVYSQKAMVLANELKDTISLAVIYATLAENYIVKKEYDLALPFLRKSIELSPPENGIAYVYNDFAQLFLGLKKYDSVNFYGKKAIKESKIAGWKDQLLRSYKYLYKSFEQTNQPDSTYKYFRLATTLKDSLFDMEKVKSIESISFQQQLKEQEKELEAQKLEEERHQNLQFALLAIGIITVVILFLLLSRSFITNTRIIKFFSVLVLLIVFEFLNLLLHPFLEKITHHSPILMLLCLVCIAALLVPLHHRIEHWATNKLVEKNKKVRLAAAKKTIEQLEADLEN